MRIKVRCSGGHELQIEEKYAGYQIRCPICKQVISVPELASEAPEQRAKRSSDLSPKAILAIALSAVSILGAASWYYLREPETTMAGSSMTQAMKSNPGSNNPGSNNPDNRVIIERTEPYKSPMVLVPSLASDNDIDRDENGFQKIPRQDGAIFYRLPQMCWSSAYDPELGSIALTDDKKGIVVFSVDDLRNGKTDPLGVFPVKGLPNAVCFKPFKERRWFAYACSSKAEITLVDAQRLEVVETIPVPRDTNISCLASSSNPSDPYLYFLQKTDNSSAPWVSVYRVDLTDKRVEEAPAVKWIDMQVSCDGRTIYAKGASTNPNVYEYDFATWEELKLRRYSERPTVQMKTSTGSSVRVLGNTVAIESTFLEPSYSSTRELSLREVSHADFEPLAFCESIPVALGVSDQGVAFGSSVTGKIISEFELPSSLCRLGNSGVVAALKGDPRFRRRYGGSVGRVSIDGYADQKRELAVATIDDHLMIVPFDGLALPNSHPLDFSLDRPGFGSIGQEMQIPIPESAIGKQVAFEFSMHKTSASEDDSAKIPMPRLDEGKIVWTPDRRLLGKQDILVTASAGDEKREWIWPIEIGYRPTEDRFDFYVQGISGAKDSELAVVWGIEPSDVTMRYPENHERPQWVDQSILVLYDTANREIKKRIVVPYEIDHAVIHPTGVYAVSTNAQIPTLTDSQTDSHSPGRVIRFDRNSLARLGAIRLPSTHSPGEDIPNYRLEVQGPNELAVLCKRTPLGLGLETSFGSDYEVGLPDLKVLRITPRAGIRIDDLDAAKAIQDGILWDETLKIPKLIVDPTRFRKIRESRTSAAMHAVSTWSSKRTMPGTYLADLHALARSTSRGLMVFSPDQDPAVKELSLLAWIPYPLSKDPLSKDPGGTEGLSTKRYDELLRSREYESICGPNLYATGAGRVYRVPAGSLPMAEKEFCFEDKQDHFVVEAGKKLAWRYSAPGATKYHLKVYLNAKKAGSSDGFEIDEGPSVKVVELESPDGAFEFEIGTELVIQSMLTYLKPFFVDPRFTLVGVIELIQEIEQPYRRLTGRIPTTLPVVATVMVTADDSAGQQQAKLSHSVLVEVPIEELIPRIEKSFLAPKSKPQ